MRTGNRNDEQDIIDVQNLHLSHPQIRAKDWRSPLVRRLLDTDRYQDGEAVVAHSYRGPQGKAIERNLQLCWTALGDDYCQCMNTYQDPVITEMATLGLACILVSHDASEEITEVTRRGERADYWIGERKGMLEVSGQQDGDIENLCSRKAVQLLSNPFAVDGYVCVAVFSNKQSRLWFYSQEGRTT